MPRRSALRENPYREGWDDGYVVGYAEGRKDGKEYQSERREMLGGRTVTYRDITKKPKRKMSAWNKYVKANSNKPRFRYRNGKLNLKKMGVAFRKTPAGRKKK